MSRQQNSTGGGFTSLNLWAIYFWLVEITFAVIGGTTEAWVYRQYMPSGQFSDLEAFARALVTQLAIVGFGAAGIKALSSIDNWSRYVVAFFAFLFALGFAFVTFDLMLVSAVAFRNAEALGAADQWPIPTPWGDMPGQQVTLFIIAGVPFFQWAMSMFGPVITKDRKPLTAEEIRTNAEADLAMIEYNARKRVAQARGLGATFAAVKAAATQSQTQGVDNAQSLHNDRANLAGMGDETQGVSDQQDMAAEALPPGVKKLRPAAKGPWLKEDFQAYIRTAYPGVEITEAVALTAVKEAGNGTLKGTAYSATITQAKAWARRHYGEPKVEGTARQARKESAQ